MTKIEWLKSIQRELMPTYGIDMETVSNVSTLGIFSHMMADILETSNYQHDIAKRESIPYTAEFYSSLLAHAKMTNTEVNMCKPAKVQCVLQILKSDLEPYKNAANVFFKIKKNVPFLIEKYNYSIPYDIIIRYETRNGNELYQAYFEPGDENDKEYRINPHYDGSLKIKIIKYANSIGLVVDLLQYSEKEADMFYVENAFRVGDIKVSHGAQLADFVCKFYGKKTVDLVDRWRVLAKDLALTKSEARDQTVYYDYNNEDSVSLIIRPVLGRFNPKGGTPMKVYYYESYGSECNIPCKGQIISVTLSPGVVGRIVTQTDSTSGSDRLTKEELRNKIIVDSINANKSYSTVKSLKNLFRGYDKNFRVEKFLDNFMERVYAVDVALKESGVFYMPTNTLPTTLDLNNGPQPTIFWNTTDSGSFNIYEPNSTLFEVSGDKLSAIMVDRTPRAYIDASYNDPYYDSTFCTAFHKTLVENGTLPKYVPYEFIQDYLKFRKENIGQNIVHKRKSGFPANNERYTIPFAMIFRNDEPRTLNVYKFFNDRTFTTEMKEMSYVDIKDSNFIISSGNLIQGNNRHGNPDKNVLKFSLYELINTADDSYKKLSEVLNSGIYEIQVGFKNKNSDYKVLFNVDEYEIEPDTDGLIVNCTSYININHKIFKDVIYLENGETLLNDNIIIDINVKKNGVLIDSGTFPIDTYFESITHLISPRYEWYKNVVTNDEFVYMSDIPLVSDTYLSNYKNTFYTKLSEYMEQLEGIHELTDQTFSLKLRFANTFGETKNLKAGFNETSIGRTNISAMFNVVVDVYTVDLENRIKTYITELISNIEWMNGEEYHISKLIEAVRGNFEEIKAIEFLGFNNLPATEQRIYYDNADDVRRVNDVIGVARRNFSLEFKVENGIPTVYYNYDLFNSSCPDIRLFFK